MFRLLHAIQVWRKNSAITDEDFEQTPANIRKYRSYKSMREKNLVPIYGGYAGSSVIAIIGVFTFGGPDFGSYIISAIFLYWIVFVFSLAFKTEETFFIARLNSRTNTRSSESVRHKWFIFFWRRFIFGLIYTFLLLLVWLLKL